MRNNKILTREELKVGLRVKIALPTWWIFHNNKDRCKRLSWWKGRIIEVSNNGAFTVYLGSYIGNLFVGVNQFYKLVKCL